MENSLTIQSFIYTVYIIIYLNDRMYNFFLFDHLFLFGPTFFGHFQRPRNYGLSESLDGSFMIMRQPPKWTSVYHSNIHMFPLLASNVHNLPGATADQEPTNAPEDLHLFLLPGSSRISRFLLVKLSRIRLVKPIEQAMCICAWCVFFECVCNVFACTLQNLSPKARPGLAGL